MRDRNDRSEVGEGAAAGLPGLLPCVWMSAGLVAFKLCDLAGECEGCPFDRAMRGLAPLPPPRPIRRRLPRGRRRHPARGPALEVGPVPPGGPDAARPLPMHGAPPPVPA
jgi:hypothetical protein